jgi:hypothetical protein
MKFLKSNYSLKFLFLFFILSIVVSACNQENSDSKGQSYTLNLDNYIQQFCKNNSEEDVVKIQKLKFFAYAQVVEFYKNRNYKRKISNSIFC